MTAPLTDAEFVESMTHTPPTEGADGIVLAVHDRDRLVALARNGVDYVRAWRTLRSLLGLPETEGGQDVLDALDSLRRQRTDAEARVRKLEDGMARDNDEICQTLGRVLGYPWYKDDQKNFPGATEADGVCVGEHVAASIAAEAARRVRELEEVLKPFVALGGPDDTSTVAFHDLSDDVAVYKNSGASITAGDVRVARAVLARRTL